MRSLLSSFIIILFLSVNTSCSAQAEKQEESAKINTPGKIEVLYFHYTRRCATCKAVENVSKEAVAELYGGKVSFAGFNLEEDKGKTKGDKLQVSGQTLLIVAGDKKINITDAAFLNARSNPDKLKAIIKERIDPLL